MSPILAEAGPVAGVILREDWHRGWRREFLCVSELLVVMSGARSVSTFSKALVSR